MEAASADVRTIEGEELTTWTVLTGGTHVRMDFIGSDGAAHRLVLPFDVLSGLLMTLPRILQTALDARFPDGSLRFVHQLGTWRIEQSEGGTRLILRLGTPDGFDVTFALTHRNASSLGAALIATPDLEQSGMRRPN
jgi:hypothetical protein